MKSLSVDKLIGVFVVIILGIAMELNIFSIISHKQLILYASIIGIVYLIFIIAYKIKKNKKS